MQMLLDAEKAVDLRGSQILNVTEYRKVVFRRRLMAVAMVFTLLGIVLFLVAVLSPNWAVIDFINHRKDHVNVQLGVWGEWRSVNGSKKAEWISHFPEPASDRYLRLAGVYLKHYYRAQAAFTIIAIVLMLIGNGLALYTFKHHRYMFKRVTAVLYFFVAMCIIVTIEVLINSVDEWNLEVLEKSLHGGNWDYSAGQKIDFPVYLSWSVVVIYILAMLVFIHGSHKQKGSRAATAEFEIEDRPFHLGRI